MVSLRFTNGVLVLLFLSSLVAARTSPGQPPAPNSPINCPRGTHFVRVNLVNCDVDVSKIGNGQPRFGCSTDNYCKKNDFSCATYDEDKGSCKVCGTGHNLKKDKSHGDWCDPQAWYKKVWFVCMVVGILVAVSVLSCVLSCVCCGLNICKCLCC